jgi:REP element-mobilizing transposase RayT
LRADERGFRDHDHRIHSSGDYRNPPPKSEHEGLRRWVIRHMHKEPVRLDRALMERVGAEMVRLLLGKGVEVVVLAVMPDHVHGIGRFERDKVRDHVGHAKRYSSHAIRDQIPGTVWGKKRALKRIRDRDHQVKTFTYIVKHSRKGAWVWTFRDARGEIGAS